MYTFLYENMIVTYLASVSNQKDFLEMEMENEEYLKYG